MEYQLILTKLGSTNTLLISTFKSYDKLKEFGDDYMKFYWKHKMLSKTYYDKEFKTLVVEVI